VIYRSSLVCYLIKFYVLRRTAFPPTAGDILTRLRRKIFGRWRVTIIPLPPPPPSCDLAISFSSLAPSPSLAPRASLRRSGEKTVRLSVSIGEERLSGASGIKGRTGEANKRNNSSRDASYDAGRPFARNPRLPTASPSNGTKCEGERVIRSRESVVRFASRSRERSASSPPSSLHRNSN